MSAFVTAGGGFLLAVLWFDLMFDVQVARHVRGELPEEVLDSIARYYRRVTTTARPMNRLVATVMLATFAAIIVELGSGEEQTWVAVVSLALVLTPIALAGGRVVPRAVRLGERVDSIERQSELARSIFVGHLVCVAAIAGLLVVQLAFA